MIRSWVDLPRPPPPPSFPVIPLNFGTAKKSSWPRQTAIVVSDSPNVHMLLRELLRSYGWSVIDSTPSVERAVTMLRQGQAFLVITDDTPTTPAVKLVRYLLSDPIAVGTPVLSFLLESQKHETAAMSRMGRPQIVDKPLTPSKFIPGFVNLVKTWEKEPLATLRRANYQFLAGNDGVGMRALDKLIEVDSIHQLVAQSASLHHRRAGKVKDAETTLLSSLKRSPHDLGLMVALADLYMHSAMPKLAHRLLAGARTRHAQSMAVVPDLVQAALLMGNVEDAIVNLYSMLKAAYMEEETSNYLARLLFAEGREAEAERVLNNNKNAFKRIQSGWANAELTPFNVAG